MTNVSYRVTNDGGLWLITRDGSTDETGYLSPEAALEIAVGEAGDDLRSGRNVVIEVETVSTPAGAQNHAAPADEQTSH